jgi:hypothetical protein
MGDDFIACKTMFTTEARRHGERRTTGKAEFTEVAEATEQQGSKISALWRLRATSAKIAREAFELLDRVSLDYL